MEERMTRKQRITISLVGIFLILLTLLGITYAYYLTRIEGNTNEESISIRTAKLELVYGDGNGDLEFIGIMPGEDMEAKTFTVTNNGNSKVDDYAVSIEEITNTLSRTEDLTYTLTCVQKNAEGTVSGTCKGASGEYPQINTMIVTNSVEVGYVHEYTLKVSYINLPSIDQSEDMGSTILGKVQIYGLTDTVDLTGTVSNATEKHYVQINSETKTSKIINGTYTLLGIKPGTHSLKVINSETGDITEQIIVINKGAIASIGTTVIEIEENATQTVPLITITNESRLVTVNIDLEDSSFEPNTTITNYNPFGEGTLAYNILNNAYNTTETQEKTNGYAIYRRTPTTKPAEEVSNADEASLSVTEDDLGHSYYFRGNVKNNYVSFAEKCWRIVRIEGDGSIRLILEDSSEMCSTTMDGNWTIGNTNVAYTFNTTSNKVIYENDWLDTELSNWYEYISQYEKNLKKVSQCFNDIPYDRNGNLITDMNKHVSDSFNSGDEIYEYNIYYDSYNRLQRENINNPTLKCATYEDGTKSTIESSYIYPLSADEVIFAGGKIDVNQGNYYLKGNNYNYWWTISPSLIADGNTGPITYCVHSQGELITNDDGHARPVITLDKTSIWSKGNGTPGNAYEIVLKS